MTTQQILEVRKDDWSATRLAEEEVPADLASGQVLLRIDRFALTSNNISYALAGDMIGYWKFFPADEGWGRIPVMGFADVEASAHPQVSQGERVFGFFPIGRYLCIEADAVNEGGFSDGVAHRADTAPVYRQYMRASSDASYEADREDQLMLLRGLFMTSFLVDDFIFDGDFYGARSFVVSSASSKTGIALAHQLKLRERGPVIGLTSPGNADFVRGLGCFDETVLYSDVKSLPADVPTVFIDHAGDGELVNTVHHHFGDNLKYSCIVGATHWDGGQRDAKLPGAEPTFFFAPGQIQKRAADWGPEGLQQRLGEGWKRFSRFADGWLEVVRGHGSGTVESVYAEVLAGRARPNQGQVLSMWDPA